MTEAGFIAWSLPQLFEEGIDVKFVNRQQMNKSGGWFSSTAKELVTCVKPENYFEVYVHEFCHFLQWRDNQAFWNKHASRAVSFGLELEKGNSGSEYRKDIQHLELDCERRVIKLIEEYKLPIDKGKYCQQANACLYFYLLGEKLKAWPSKYAYSDELAAHFPKYLMKLKEYNKISLISKEARALMEKAY